MNRTRAQLRAADALHRVLELETSKHADWLDEYAGYVERLPAAILINGLGQAAAFELAAAGKDQESPHRQLYRDLEGWLCGEHGPYYQPGEKPHLMQAIVSRDRATYLQAQAEALAWLEWLKKFAVAYLKKPDATKPAGEAKP